MGRKDTDAGGDAADAKIRYDAQHSREEVVAYLQSILSGLREGDLELRAGSSIIRMRPAEQLEVDVRAVRKDGKAKLRIEIAWDPVPGEDG